MLFTNYWYWFPYITFLPLSFAPTALIGVDLTLNIPKSFQVKCKAKKSLFDYPEMIKPINKKKKKKLKKVELSTTVKAEAHQEGKKDKKKEMVTIEEEKEDNEDSKKEPEDIAIEIEEEKKEEVEPNEHIVNNPFRVISHQIPHIEFLPDNRYEPILKVCFALIP